MTCRIELYISDLRLETRNLQLPDKPYDWTERSRLREELVNDAISDTFTRHAVAATKGPMYCLVHFISSMSGRGLLTPVDIKKVKKVLL